MPVRGWFLAKSEMITKAPANPKLLLRNFACEKLSEHWLSSVDIVLIRRNSSEARVFAAYTIKTAARLLPDNAPQTIAIKVANRAYNEAQHTIWLEKCHITQCKHDV